MRSIFYSPMSLKYGGGCENWFSGLSKILINKEKIKVGFIDTNYTPTKRWSDKEVSKRLHKVKHHRINEFFIGNILLPKWKNIDEIVKICRNYDIIYFNFSFMFQDLLMYLVKKRVKKPVICGIHAPLFFGNKLHDLYVKIVTKNLFKKFDAIHVLNKTDEKIIKRWGIKKVYCIPSGSDIEHFKLKKFKTIKKLRFLFIGRLAKQKGIDILVNSIEQFLKQNPKAKIEFNIVGSGELKYLVNKIKNHKKVNYLGFVDNIVKTYQDNDVIIVPSRQETFGLIITEGNSCGLPTISSKIPGPDRLIKEGQNGWFLKELTANELTRKIEYVYYKWLKNNDFIKEKGLFGRNFVEKNFSLNKTAKGFNKMFKETLKSRCNK